MTSAHEVNSETYRARLSSIAALIHDADRPVLVGIDGRSGSGKTTFAAWLARELHPLTVTSFEVEDFIGGWHALTRDIAKVGAIAEGIQRDGHATATPWDWVNGKWAVPIDVSGRADVVLVVGCGSTSRSVRPHLDVTVWIEVEDEVRRQRVEARDPYDWSEFWDVWAAQEDALLAECPSNELADVNIRPDTAPARQ